MDIVSQLVSMEQLKELEKNNNEKTFIKIVKLQQDVCKNEIDKKNKELEDLKEMLKALKAYTKTGPRAKA